MAADDHQLTDTQLTEIFDNQIVPWLFGDATPSTHPVLLLIGAQPGAGKTRAGQWALRDLDQPAVRIIGDNLRRMHPSYLDLLTEHPAAMPAATAQASGAWVERACDYAAQHRISTLVEGTFRNPDVTMNTARQFSSTGFRVDAHVVAVAPEVSRLSIAARFVDDEQHQGEARFTPLPAHDDAFANLPTTIRRIAEEGSPADRIVVRTRDRVLVDRHRRFGWAIDGVVEAAQAEWSRMWSDAEIDEWLVRASTVVGYLRANHSGDRDTRDLADQIDRDRRRIKARRPG